MAIKLRVVDWWNDDNKANFDANPFIKLLRQKYEVVYSDTPDFILCGPFGDKHFDYDCVKIFYTGENIRINWNLYDYGMGYDYMDFGECYLHLPLFYLYDYDFEGRDLGKRNRFCAYIVRHSGATKWGAKGGLRDRFFDRLSAYKRVDSGGGWRNNIGRSVENKNEWLKDYKFNICFENSSYPGYLTEKLFDAYNAGCVPIYWGDTSLRVGGNSSLGMQFRTCENFGDFADTKSSLNPQNSHKYKSHTANTRIVDSKKGEFTESSLRDSALQNRGNPHNNSMGGGIAIIPMI